MEKQIALLSSESGLVEFEPKLTNVRVFIDDDLQTFPVFENDIDISMNIRAKYFVPLDIVLEKTGTEVRKIDPNIIHIINKSGRNIFIKLEENGARYRVFLANDISDLTEEVQLYEKKYLIIDNLVYLPLYEFPEFTDLDVYDDIEDILIYSKEYYESNHIIYKNIGHQISLNTYINGIKIDSPVFKNTSRNNDSYNVNDFTIIVRFKSNNFPNS